jgi:death-on-curing protein
MTRYLSSDELLILHRQIIAQTGGHAGLRDMGAIEAASAQPRMTFAGNDLYPSIAQKAAALGFSLIANHPFVDGNKRIGHAAMETFLLLNGYEIAAPIEEQELLILAVAAGTCEREFLAHWLDHHIIKR